MSDKPLHVAVGMDDLLSATVEHIPRGLMEKWLGKVHCGDSIELMNRMPAESVGLCVTSPPYNIRNSTGNGLKDGRGASGRMPRCSVATPNIRTICRTTSMLRGSSGR